MHGKQSALQGSGHKQVPKGSELSPVTSSSFITTCLSCHSPQILPAANQAHNTDIKLQSTKCPQDKHTDLSSLLSNTFTLLLTKD